MPGDPNLTDTCFFFAPDPNLPVWLSPDISVTGPETTGDIRAGVANSIQVQVSRSADPNCSLPPGMIRVIVDLFICVPATGLAPNNPTLAMYVNPPVSGIIPLASIPPGTQQTVPISWTPVANAPTGSPQSADPPHHCLIARCYPNVGNTPDPNNFYVGSDQHYAQHNLAILPYVPPPQPHHAPPPHGPPHRVPEFAVAVLNPDAHLAQRIQVKFTPDLNPTPALLQLVTKRARGVPGFQRVVTTAPPAILGHFPDFPHVALLNTSAPGFVHPGLARLGVPAAAAPNYESQLDLRAGQVTRLNFDLSAVQAQPGEAHIFHVSQTGPDGKVHGGVTFVTVAVGS